MRACRDLCYRAMPNDGQVVCCTAGVNGARARKAHRGGCSCYCSPRAEHTASTAGAHATLQVEGESSSNDASFEIADCGNFWCGWSLPLPPLPRPRGRRFADVSATCVTGTGTVAMAPPATVAAGSTEPFARAARRVPVMVPCHATAEPFSGRRCCHHRRCRAKTSAR